MEKTEFEKIIEKKVEAVMDDLPRPGETEPVPTPEQAKIDITAGKLALVTEYAEMLRRNIEAAHKQGMAVTDKTAVQVVSECLTGLVEASTLAKKLVVEALK